MQEIDAHKSFGGWQKRYKHASSSCNCEMTFSVYLPPQVDEGKKLPVLFWLSGLTCTDENFVTKAGAQKYAAEYGLMIVAPDTSPRGEGVADDEAYDLGQGAGFYVNATQEPWAPHYKMYDYIVDELPALIEKEFPVDMERQSIFGHSMGGHGALIIALKNPGRFQSVSAFAPIVAPASVPWGQKVFAEYLGDDAKNWSEWDACELMKQADQHIPIGIDQGLADEFLETHLQPERLEEVAKQKNWPLTVQRHEGYDHSYFFISTFMEEHIRFHANYLAVGL